MKKWVSTLLCLLLCLTMAASAMAEIAVTTTGLTLRQKASSKAKALGKIPKGETVEVLEKGSWAKVSYNGKEGYVSQKYLEYIATPEPTAEPTAEPTPVPTAEPTPAPASETVAPPPNFLA